jgi:hypothetical protein
VGGLAARAILGRHREGGPGQGDDRLGRRLRRHGQALLLAIVALILSVVLPEMPMASATSPPAQLLLDAQTPWATGPSGVSLSLSVQDGPVPSARLSLQLTLLTPFGSRSALEASFAGRPAPGSAVLDQPPPVPVDALARTTSARPVYVLHVRLETSGATGAPAGAPALQLPCTTFASCDGVYPLEVALVDSATGATLASLTTYLVVAVVPKGSRPLDVALVLDLAGPPPMTPAGRPSLRRAWLSTAGAVLAFLGREPRPVCSFLVPGDLLVSLESSGRRGRQLLDALRALSREPSREFLAPPFAPLDLSALAEAGLDGQLRADLSLGAAAARETLGELPTAPVWLSTSAVGSSAPVLLTRAGLHALIVPSSDTAPSDPMTTPTSPFDARPGPLEVLPADVGLAAHFTGSDPALAAVELAADLTQIYLDAPFSARPRGVLVTVPLGSRPGTAAVVEGDLAALASGEVVRPLTVPALLAEVPPSQSVPLAGGVSDGVRRLLVRPPGRTEVIPRTDAAAAALALASLQSLETVETPALLQARQALLLGESADVAPSARLAYLDVPRAVLAATARRLHLPSRRTVTLTAMTARVPFTIVSTARNPLRVLVTLSSPDLRFPNGREFPVVLEPGEDTLYLDIGARSSGDFPLSISLLAPAGGLLLAREHVTVRSTAISWVALVLSGAALVLLAGWWLRTSRRRRRDGVPGSARPRDAGPRARTSGDDSGRRAVHRVHSRRPRPAHAAGRLGTSAGQVASPAPRAPIPPSPPGGSIPPLAE